MKDSDKSPSSRGCPCPYCTAIRAGVLPTVAEMWSAAGEEAPSERGLWRRRMEGGGRIFPGAGPR